MYRNIVRIYLYVYVYIYLTGLSKEWGGQTLLRGALREMQLPGLLMHLWGPEDQRPYHNKVFERG